MLTCKGVNQSLNIYDLTFSQKIEEYIIKRSYDRILNITSGNVEANKNLFEQLKFQYIFKERIF